MGKKQVAVSLRKPPPPAPSDLDAFVANDGGGDSVKARAVTAPPAPAPKGVDSAPVVATRAGERREVTVYLPQDLARKLSVRCMELDRDVSNVVAEAVDKALAGEEANADALEPVVVPLDRWQRARAVLVSMRDRLPTAWRFGIV